MTAALARDAVVLDFVSPSAVALAAERHNRMRRLRRALYRSFMPMRSVDVLTAASLGADASEIWWRLMTRLWLDGQLPGDPAALAQAAKVSRRRWERYAFSLESLFQRTDEGGWMTHDLIRFRDQMIARFDLAEAHMSAGAQAFSLQQERQLAKDLANAIFDSARAIDPPPLTIGLDAECSAQLELRPRQLQAWRFLLLHLLEHGHLPMGQTALARICRLRLGSFRTMEPMLARHFDREVDGRWTHTDVIAGRGKGRTEELATRTGEPTA